MIEAAKRRLASGAGALNAASSRKRRGQTIILAIAILFLLFIVGGIFITMIIRNLQRVTRQSETDSTLTQALAGLQFASNQFRTSPLGADWRPRTVEPVWRNPADPAPAAQRANDPDRFWLDPTVVEGGIPYTRFANGLGRFLLRVTYIPSFKPASAASTFPDEFDPNSAFIHVECIGRAGEFDANDPTFFEDPTTAGSTNPGQIKGPHRKVEAWVPIGIVDQLWWVTNFTNERAPAQLGVPPFRDANGRPVEYTAIYRGGIRSNTDLQLNGGVVVRVYPARGEGVQVRGNIRYGEVPPNLNLLPGQVQALDDDDTNVGPNPNPGPGLPSDQQDDDPSNDRPILYDLTAGRQAADEIRPSGAGFNPVPVQLLGGRTKPVVADEQYARSEGASGVEAQSVRFFDPPRLDVADPATGQNRWHALTRDSGQTIQIQDGTNTRTINTGLYGLVDWLAMHDPNDDTDDPNDDQLRPLRAKGLYIDNFSDIQYPNDRRAVKDEWRQRGPSDVRRRGWLGDYYVPSVVEGGVNHPIADVYLTALRRDPDPQRRDDPTNPVVPKIIVTRYDFDVRQNNLAPATGRQRLFYRRDPLSGDLVPVGSSQEFEYPENGVLYAEGSIRIRGAIGMSSLPRQLTVVSGGTIYIEGNLLKAHEQSFLALLAKDYVTLNPTAFTRIRPGASVVVEADTFAPNGTPTGYHFTIPQGGDLDFSFSDAGSMANGLLFVKHSAPYESNNSETAVTLNHPANRGGWPDWTLDRVNFGQSFQNGTLPANSIPWLGNPQAHLFYLFHPISPGGGNFWWESNAQTVNGSPANFERKAFWLQQISSDNSTLPSGLDTWFRFVVGPRDGADTNGDGFPDPEMSPNGQPYWLSRVALLPHYQDDPLPGGAQRDGRPLQIKIEAVMYAYTGSWFVIPPPFFNDNDEDSREAFVARGGARATGTFPNNTSQYPFYNEPLNVEVTINGAISENMPAESSEAQSWTDRTWWANPDTTHNPAADYQEADQRPYRPNIKYNYDPRLRRMIRVRYTRPYYSGGVLREEEIISVAPTPGGPPPPNTRTLQFVINEARANGSYVETLPVLPNLPTSALVYEGNPL